MDRPPEVNDWVARDLVAEKMAGEVTLSPEPGKTLSKWREEFGVTQTQLSEEMDVSPSVISDYESDRRSSPGVKIIKNFIEALLDIDEANGGAVVKAIADNLGLGTGFEGVMAMNEYDRPVPLEGLADAVKGEILVDSEMDTHLRGFTVIDSLEAIKSLSPGDFNRLYGWSTERAMVFTRVTTGKSPLVAIRVTNLKPGAVVLHGIEDVDPVAERIAELEDVPLLKTNAEIGEIMDRLYEEVSD